MKKKYNTIDLSGKLILIFMGILFISGIIYSYNLDRKPIFTAYKEKCYLESEIKVQGTYVCPGQNCGRTYYNSIQVKDLTEDWLNENCNPLEFNSCEDLRCKNQVITKWKCQDTFVERK